MELPNLKLDADVMSSSSMMVGMFCNSRELVHINIRPTWLLSAPPIKSPMQDAHKNLTPLVHSTARQAAPYRATGL
jgi:hypothetical protein